MSYPHSRPAAFGGPFPAVAYGGSTLGLTPRPSGLVTLDEEAETHDSMSLLPGATGYRTGHTFQRDDPVRQSASGFALRPSQSLPARLTANTVIPEPKQPSTAAAAAAAARDQLKARTRSVVSSSGALLYNHHTPEQQPRGPRPRRTSVDAAANALELVTRQASTQPFLPVFAPPPPAPLDPPPPRPPPPPPLQTLQTPAVCSPTGVRLSPTTPPVITARPLPPTPAPPRLQTPGYAPHIYASTQAAAKAAVATAAAAAAVTAGATQPSISGSVDDLPVRTSPNFPVRLSPSTRVHPATLSPGSGPAAAPGYSLAAADGAAAHRRPAGPIRASSWELGKGEDRPAGRKERESSDGGASKLWGLIRSITSAAGGGKDPDGVLWDARPPPPPVALDPPRPRSSAGWAPLSPGPGATTATTSMLPRPPTRAGELSGSARWPILVVPGAPGSQLPEGGGTSRDGDKTPVPPTPSPALRPATRGGMAAGYRTRAQPAGSASGQLSPSDGAIATQPTEVPQRPTAMRAPWQSTGTLQAAVEGGDGEERSSAASRYSGARDRAASEAAKEDRVVRLPNGGEAADTDEDNDGGEKEEEEEVEEEEDRRPQPSSSSSRRVRFRRPSVDAVYPCTPPRKSRWRKLKWLRWWS